MCEFLGVKTYVRNESDLLRYLHQQPTDQLGEV